MNHDGLDPAPATPLASHDPITFFRVPFPSQFLHGLFFFAGALAHVCPSRFHPEAEFRARTLFRPPSAAWRSGRYRRRCGSRAAFSNQSVVTLKRSHIADFSRAAAQRDPALRPFRAHERIQCSWFFALVSFCVDDRTLYHDPGIDPLDAATISPAVVSYSIPATVLLPIPNRPPQATAGSPQATSPSVRIAAAPCGGSQLCRAQLILNRFTVTRHDRSTDVRRDRDPTQCCWRCGP